VAGSTFLFLEAAPVSVRFRAAEAGSGWVAALACLAEAHLLAPEADFHERADDFLARVVDSPVPVDDFRAAVAGFHAPVAGSPWQAVDSRERADGLAADSHEPEVDSLARVAALADSAVVHSHAPEADFLAPADEPGVELPVTAADFRAWVAALADSPVVHSHAPEADFRELAAPSGSPELARWRALAVDCRVPLVSPVVLRLAYLAVLPAAFLQRVAVADSRAVLRLCSLAALEQASHSP
jgi:hypothetical protein